MLQMGDTVYRAENIRDQLFVGTFSLLIMSDTERPRYTGFRGLSVRGITALQCICHLARLHVINLNNEFSYREYHVSVF